MMKIDCREVAWDEYRDILSAIRETVFVQEQGVPLELEWDEQDAHCRHVLASLDGAAVGTGRITAEGHIGRMAVLAPWRGQGVGSALLRTLMLLAGEQGLSTVYLNAQISAEGFYRRHHFVSDGEPFMDAGIPHVRMRHALDRDRP